MSAARLMTLMVSLALMVGCAGWNSGENGAGTGALTGALIGAGIGYAWEGSTDGAVAGALIGGAVGAGVGYAAGNMLEDRDETIASNPSIRETLARPGVSAALAIERVRLVPDRVRPGEALNINVIHAYVGSGAAQEFTLRITVVDSAARVLIDESMPLVFEDGTHSTDIPLTVPAEWTPGNYALDIELRTPGARDNRSAVFSVL